MVVVTVSMMLKIIMKIVIQIILEVGKMKKKQIKNTRLKYMGCYLESSKSTLDS